MRTLFNDNQIYLDLTRRAIRFSFIPVLFIAPVMALSIPVESIYDYLLEVTRLYCVLIMASVTENLVNSKVIRIGIILAIINGVYDAITEILYIEQVISHRFPFADALIDEALLIAAYGCIIFGLFRHLSKVNKLSLTDNLTKCYTRTALKLLPRGSYQLFYFDLDKFKLINDTKGHNVGDKVLIIFARRLMRCCDNIGYAFRVGGDEFIAIIDTENAQDFIEIFTKACEVEGIEFSYGTAACESIHYDKAIAEADENLYEMKQFKSSNYPFNLNL
ncbi:GGDEF domain-containing protein [Vibrio sp. 404]|uniref:diguanylate cyclase n=1 Tax=Vibrio marinisediminis TaxID=2758441 RepID=A0A7W2IV45_9VIBR|nr:GGDEF domain-containing protein [Vibrio marinisediminis]MBA5764003.1 GGDEF domain-containing protein [Vibrio marinisediminis]